MQQTERINPFFQRRVSTDTDTVFASARPGAADETTANGTDKSVPYKVRSKTQQRIAGMRNSTVFTNVSIPGDRKTQHRTNVWRQFSGFVGNFDTETPQYAYPYSLKSLLKKGIMFGL